MKNDILKLIGIYLAIDGVISLNVLAPETATELIQFLRMARTTAGVFLIEMGA